jgi:hypothetical protein
VGALEELVGDAGDFALRQRVDVCRPRHGEVLKRADYGTRLDYSRLIGGEPRHAANEVGAAKNLLPRVDDARAGVLIISVEKMGVRTGALFDQDRMSQVGKTAHREGAQAHAVLIPVLLAGYSNDHRIGLRDLMDRGVRRGQFRPGCPGGTR